MRQDEGERCSGRERGTPSVCAHKCVEEDKVIKVNKGK